MHPSRPVTSHLSLTMISALPVYFTSSSQATVLNTDATQKKTISSPRRIIVRIMSSSSSYGMTSHKQLTSEPHAHTLTTISRKNQTDCPVEACKSSSRLL